MQPPADRLGEDQLRLGVEPGLLERLGEHPLALFALQRYRHRRGPPDNRLPTIDVGECQLRVRCGELFGQSDRVAATLVTVDADENILEHVFFFTWSRLSGISRFRPAAIHPVYPPGLNISNARRETRSRDAPGLARKRRFGDSARRLVRAR